jgi:hypothetical protein
MPSAPVITGPRSGNNFSTNSSEQFISGVFNTGENIVKIFVNNTFIQDQVNGSVDLTNGTFVYGTLANPVLLTPGDNVFAVKVQNNIAQDSPSDTIQIRLVTDADIQLSVSPVTGIDKRVKRDAIEIIWEESEDPNVDGYNVYYSLEAGGGLAGYKRSNATLITEPSFFEDKEEEVSRSERVSDTTVASIPVAITAQNGIATSPLLPQFTVLSSELIIATVSWFLSGDTNLTNCVRIELRAPDGDVQVLKNYGVVDTGSFVVTTFYEDHGAGEYSIVLSELLGCSGASTMATLVSVQMAVQKTSQDKTVSIVSQTRRVNFYTHLITSVDGQSVGGIPEGTPIYTVISAIGFNTILFEEVESAFSAEQVAIPLTLNSEVKNLPARAFSDIVKSYITRIFTFERGPEQPDVKAGTVWRDIAIDPPAQESEYEYRIIDFVSRSQSFLTLLALDDGDNDGISDEVAASVYKQSLKEALGGGITDLQVQQVIDTGFDKLAANVSVFRKSATSAEGDVIFYAAQIPEKDLRVPAGTTLTSIADLEAGIPSQQFVLLGDVNLFVSAATSFFVPERNRYEVIGHIRAVAPGTLGNIPAGFIQSISAGSGGSLGGFTGVENLESTVFGSDQESNAFLAERAIIAFTSVDVGTEGGYRSAALRQSNVRKCVVIGAGDSPMLRDFFCFLENTLVTMGDGTVLPIQSVKIGDEVITHDGTPQKVLKTMHNEVDEEIYQIKVASMPFPLEVTWDHPILIAQAKNTRMFGQRRTDLGFADFSWIRAKNVKKDDACFIPTPKLSVDRVLSEITMGLAELIGWYVAEGSVNPNPSKKSYFSYVHFDLGSDEESEASRILELASKYRHLWKEDGYIEISANKRRHGKYGSYCMWDTEVHTKKHLRKRTTKANEKVRHYGTSLRVDVFNPVLAEFCYKHGGYKAQNKILSPELMSTLCNNEHLARAFMEAFVAGDGHYNKYGALQIVTSSIQLREQLFWIFSAHGVFARRVTCKNTGGPTNREKNGLVGYHLGVNQHQTRKWWGDRSQGYTQIEHKHNVWPIAASMAAEVEWVRKKHHKGSVYNLTIEKNASYTTNGIISSNCPTLEHIGGKVDIYIQGDVLQQVQEDFAFNFTEVKNERVFPTNPTGMIIRVSNPNVSILYPVFQVTEVRNITRGGAAYDLINYVITDGIYLDLDEACAANIFLGMGSFDILEVSYFYRGSQPYVFRNQPVREITRVVGEFSGVLEDTTNYKLFKLEDPLLLGNSTEAQDYMLVSYANGVPLGDFKVITNEPHTMISTLSINLNSLGVITSSIIVTSVDGTITYTPDIDYTITEGNNRTKTQLTRKTGGAIADGQEIEVTYEAGESFTVFYTVNKLLDAVQFVIDGDENIDGKRHVTADVVVKDVVVNDVDLEFTVVTKRGVSRDLVDSKIRTVLTRFINQKPVGENVYRSDLIGLIERVQGVDYIVLPLSKMVKSDGSQQVFEEVLGSNFRFLPFAPGSYITAKFGEDALYIAKERHILSGIDPEPLVSPRIISGSVVVRSVDLNNPETYQINKDYVLSTGRIFDGQDVLISYKYGITETQVTDEAHTLFDGVPEPLSNTGVLLGTISVTDENHVIIYIENSDYTVSTTGSLTLIESQTGDFTFVTRKLSAITDGQTVHVSYRHGILPGVQVNDEVHVLNGTALSTLTNPVVITSSIIVRNTAHTITYGEDVDYLLEISDVLTSIKRRQKILDGQQVQMDYTAARFGQDGLEVQNEEHILILNQLEQLDNIGVIDITIVVKNVGGTVTYAEALDYTIYTDEDANTYLTRVSGGAIVSGQKVLVSYEAFQIVPVQALKHKTIAGGGFPNIFRGFYVNEVRATLVDDPRLVGVRPSTAYINSDGSLVLSKSDGHFNHKYFFTYQIYGDSGDQDLIVSPLEALQIGNIIITYND